MHDVKSLSEHKRSDRKSKLVPFLLIGLGAGALVTAVFTLGSEKTRKMLRKKYRELLEDEKSNEPGAKGEKVTPIRR